MAYADIGIGVERKQAGGGLNNGLARWCEGGYRPAQGIGLRACWRRRARQGLSAAAGSYTEQTQFQARADDILAVQVLSDCCNGSVGSRCR